MDWGGSLFKKTQRGGEMQEPPNPDLHHSLLGYKALVTSDVPVISTYTLTSGSTYTPHVASRLDVLNELSDFEIAPHTSMQMVPTALIQDETGRKALYKEFTQNILPTVILPTITEKTRPNAFRQRVLSTINKQLLHFWDTPDAANTQDQVLDLYASLRAAFPENQRVQDITAPTNTKQFTPGNDLCKHLDKMLTDDQTFPTLADQEKLHTLLRDYSQKHNKVKTFNAHILDVPYSCGAQLGFTDAQVETITHKKFDTAAAPGQTLELTIDTTALAKASRELLHRLKTDLPRQMKQNLVTAAQHVHDLARAFNTTNFNYMPLSPEAAEKNLNMALARVPENSLATRLMRIGLSNPDLNIVLIASGDTTAYWSGFQKEKLKKLKDHRVGGYSEGNRNRVYASLGDNSYHATDIVVEEILHNSFRNLYKDNTSQLTYPPQMGQKSDSFYFRDIRKDLFIEALRSDMNNMGRNIAIMRHDLHLDKELYDGKDFHAEAVVKIIKMKALNHWTAAHERRYHHLSQYIEKVITPDVANWEKCQREGKYHPNHMLTPDAAEFRRENPLVTKKQPFNHEKPVLLKRHENKNYIVLNADYFAFDQNIDAEKFMNQTLSLLPNEPSTAPRPDRITYQPTDKGTIVTIPDELLKNTLPKVQGALNAIANKPLIALRPPTEPNYDGEDISWSEQMKRDKNPKKPTFSAAKDAGKDWKTHVTTSDETKKTTPLPRP